MSFLGAFTSLISSKVWSDLPASFCYSIGNKVPNPFETIFQLFDGVDLSNKSKVSIFVFDKKSTILPASTLAMRLENARNCLKHIRIIRHPYILRAFEAVEVPSGIYIVTEHVRPLVTSDIPSDPIWGIFQIGSAIEFLHNDVKAVHGLITPLSIFVTQQDAHWRLGGFDIIRPLTLLTSSSISHDFVTSIQDHPFKGSGYSPPLDTLTPLGLDKWGLVSLIAWIFASLKLNSEDARHRLPLAPENNISKIPAKAQKLCKELLQSSRTTSAPFNFKHIVASSAFFSESSVLKVMLFFDQINLKGNWEKETFFTSLPEVLRSIPTQIQLLLVSSASQHLQVVPQLARQLDFYPQPTLILPSILIIGETLLSENEPKKEEIYKSRIVPVLIKLFKCPDRAIRYSLLQHLTNFESYLTSNDVEEIFDSLCLGFTDTSNILREATLKSMCIFVPKLKKTSCIEKAVRLITRLVQKDSEGPIRTNAIICFAKLVPSFPKDQANKILSTTLLGALRDPFPPCRLAVLQLIAISAGQEIFSPNEIVTGIMPTVCQRCVDSESQVRHFSFIALETLLYQARINLDAQQEMNSDNTPVQDSSITESNGKKTIEQSTKNQSSSGWTGWALKKAIDFYGSKDAGGVSTKSTFENTPSGQLKSQVPTPPPSTPTTHISMVDKPKPIKQDQQEDEFFDADEVSGGGNYDEDTNRWNDFADPWEFRHVDQHDLKSSPDQNSKSITPTTPVPLLTPPPKFTLHIAKPINASNSSAIPCNSTTAAYSVSQKQSVPQQQTIPSGLSNPLKLKQVSTASTSKGVGEDFWNTFDSSKSKPTTDPSKLPGSQSLKDILKKNVINKKIADDPLSDLL